MKHREFAKLCDGAALYVWPFVNPILVARGGVRRGTHWILGEGEEFHILATLNLVEKRIPRGVVWTAADGTPAFVIMELGACEEINEAEAREQLHAAMAEYDKPGLAAWLRQQLDGAGQAGPLALTWHKPTPQPA